MCRSFWQRGLEAGRTLPHPPPWLCYSGVILRAAAREWSRLKYLLARKGGPQIIVAKRPAEVLQKPALG